MAPQAHHIPDYAMEYQLAEAIEDYYAGRFAPHYAHTDADGTTVLAGRVDLVQAEREAQAERPLWQQVCDPDWRMARER